VAIINTAAAVPAFLGMQDNRRFAFLGIGNVNIYLTGFDTLVTPVAFLRVKIDWTIGGWHIGQGMYFLGHISSLRFQNDFKVQFVPKVFL
jgi:hypothetical protein